MKASSLSQLSTIPAPAEWRTIPEIKSQYPKQRNREISLQRLSGTNICVWMVGWGGVWDIASDYFYVEESK